MRNPNRIWKRILPLVAGILLSSTSNTYKRKRSGITGTSSVGNIGVVVVVVNAYISSSSTSTSGTVPIDRQIKWLRQITNDLVQTNIGQLSTRQLSQTRELMHELAHNPKLVSNYCIDPQDNQYECAITIESLLRRVVAEQKNTAVATKKSKQETTVPKEYRSILTIQNTNNNNNNIDVGGYSFDILQQQQQQQYNQQQQSNIIELTVDDYNCVLEGWAKSPSASIKTAERCEQILNGMIVNGPYPNHQSFATCINAWKHAMDNNNNSNKNPRQYNTDDMRNKNKNPDIQQRTQRQRQEQKYIDTQTVAPERAQRLLELMIRSYDSSCPERSAILPNSASCFDTVLKMWSRSTNNPTAPYEAERLVAIMDKISRTLNIEELRPKRISLHYVMTTWVNSKSQQQQHDTNDDTTSSSSTGSSSSLEDSAPYRVASILDFMNQRATQLGEADVAPNGVSYNIALNSFTHQSEPEHLYWAANKAQSYVNQIVLSYKIQTTATTTTPTDLPVVVPDTILFNTAMGLWGKAKKHFTSSSKTSSRRSVQSFGKARQILSDQIDLYENYNCIQCKPDVFGFTTVIGCCSAVKYPMEQQEAFNVAYETFNQLRDMSITHNDFGTTLRPNHITYGAMLKACARLLPIDSIVRRDVVSNVFNECIENGHVSDLVVSWLRDATISTDDYNNLLQGYTRKTVPYSWSVNVHDNKHNKRRRLV